MVGNLSLVIALLVSTLIAGQISLTTAGAALSQSAQPQPTATQTPDISVMSREQSPNGRWTVTTHRLYSPKEEYYAIVGENAGTRRWKVEFRRAWDSHWEQAWLQPTQWSADGRSLYLTYYPVDYDGRCWYENGFGLVRLNLSNGKVTLIHFRARPSALAVAPSERWLIYTRDCGQIFVLRDMKTGTERQLRMRGTEFQAGSVLWSPDETAIVFVYADIRDDNPQTFSIRKLDVRTFAQSIVLSGATTFFDPIRWLDFETVILRERGDNPKDWRLNLRTGELKL